MKIQNTADFGNANGVKGLIYGPAGVGKTRLASTAVSPFVISAEAGLLSLSQHNIPYVAVRTMDDVYEAYNMVVRGQAQQFNDIFLDSLSDIMESLLAAEKKTNKDPRKAYGALADRGVELAKAFRDLPGKNIWVLCKEQMFKDDNTGISTIQPWLPGSQLGPALPYLFDEVFRYETGVDRNQTPAVEWSALRCKRNDYCVAKDRSGRLAEYELPNISVITNKILGRT